MGIRNNIYRIIEPRTKGSYAGLYDAVMLLAIIIGIFPLMFRTQYKLFWWFDLISGLCFHRRLYPTLDDGRLKFQEEQGGSIFSLSFYSDGDYRPIVYSASLQSACPILQDCSSIAILEDYPCIQVHQVFRTIRDYTICYPQTR